MTNQTEKEKMIAGQLYRPDDEMLRQDRLRARNLLKEYNESHPGEDEKRISILKNLFGRIAHRIAIEPPFHCDYGYNIKVGDNFYANFNCIILDCTEVIIGKNVFLGPNVQIYTATHPLAVEERYNGLESAKPITIENNVWIGGGAIISPGITIGEGTTIGSGSVVTKDIPSHVFAAGNPYRVIRSLN